MSRRPRSNASRGAVTALAIAVATLLAARPVLAQAPVSVTSCPGEAKLPVSFEIDCSHVADPAVRALCKPFIENQACKVFPAYREITGIKLEEYCRSIKYTIYDQDKWPLKEGDAGGAALHCAVEYVTDYSVKAKAPAKIGPYETHEILHEYHEALGAIPYQHILFGPSQAEAMRLVGDADGYDRAIARMKQTTGTFEDDFAKFVARSVTAPRSNTDKCVLAEVQVEETLYLENPKTIYAFYRKLVPSRLKDQADREARFNRTYNTVSDGRSRSFLMAHGCAAF
jgi:hypothetical protein